MGGGEVALKDNNYSCWCSKTPIAQSIQNIVGSTKYDKGLGEFVTAKKIFLCAYFTKEPCTFEEAETQFLGQIDGIYGDCFIDSHYVGYSEYTIDGLVIDKFWLGGHDLDSEFRDHIDEYANIKIQYDAPEGYWY